jgi:hypothetical protein
MDHSDIISFCKGNLTELLAMVSATESTVLKEEGGSSLIRENVNFFTKSFLLTLCANLETCIKDVIYSIGLEIDSKLANANVPANIVEWKFSTKSKKTTNNDANDLFKIKMSKKDVDDLVSGNVYKTKDAFMVVGIDLSSDKPTWETWKELIQSIVTRRNNIVHHNDDASDISFGDIKTYIKSVNEYLDFINAKCIR